MEAILAVLAVVGATALATSLRVLWVYWGGVFFRLVRLRGARGPGLIFLVPFGVERMQRVGLRIVAMDIQPQDVITRDNVSVKVNAVLYFKVAVPVKAIVEVEDFLFATSQLAQTTLRSVIGLRTSFRRAASNLSCNRAASILISRRASARSPVPSDFLISRFPITSIRSFGTRARR